jgi:hypothetical protein
MWHVAQITLQGQRNCQELDHVLCAACLYVAAEFGLSTMEEEISGILPLLVLRHACRVSRGSMLSAVLGKHFLVHGRTRLQGWVKSWRLGTLCG